MEVYEGGENHIRELSVSNCNEKCPERCRSLEEEDFIEEITFSERFSLEFKHLECCSGRNIFTYIWKILFITIYIIHDSIIGLDKKCTWRRKLDNRYIKSTLLVQSFWKAVVYDHFVTLLNEAFGCMICWSIEIPRWDLLPCQSSFWRNTMKFIWYLEITNLHIYVISYFSRLKTEVCSKISSDVLVFSFCLTLLLICFFYMF